MSFDDISAKFVFIFQYFTEMNAEFLICLLSIKLKQVLNNVYHIKYKRIIFP